jgi:hypothetical protein
MWFLVDCFCSTIFARLFVSRSWKTIRPISALLLWLVFDPAPYADPAVEIVVNNTRYCICFCIRRMILLGFHRASRCEDLITL